MKAGPALRQAVRASQSRPLVDRIRKACQLLARNKRFLPRSAMANALEYALAQMPGLTVYLEDGRIEIDNNHVENAIRPTALGKKNWLFMVKPTPEIAAPSSKLSSRAAAGVLSILTITYKTCSRACLR